MRVAGRTLFCAGAGGAGAPGGAAGRRGGRGPGPTPARGHPGLPANLHAEELTDLVVRVLGHEKAVQARRFAGMSRATHADAQVRFDQLLRALEQWRQGLQ